MLLQSCSEAVYGLTGIIYDLCISNSKLCHQDLSYKRRKDSGKLEKDLLELTGAGVVGM